MLSVTAVLAFLQYEQWRATAQNTEITNRAWVMVTEVRFAAPPEVGKPARVLIAFQNAGHIPARGVHLGVITSVGDEPCAFVVTGMTPNYPVHTSVIGPGAQVAYPLDTPPYGPGLAVKGLITYADSLGADRATNFIYHFDAALGAFVPCPRGNTFE